MFSHDIAATLQMMGMVRADSNGDACIVVDWDMVEKHMERVRNSKARIEIDAECLRWTPLITSVTNPFRVEMVSVIFILKGGGTLW